MRIPEACGVLCFGLVALTACSQAEPATSNASPVSAPTISVYEEMTAIVAPQAQVIWDISILTMDDDGDISSANMSEDSWTAAQAATAQLSASMGRLAVSENLLAALPGQQLQNEEYDGAATATDVQQLIDADGAGFNQQARAMADFATSIGRAAQAHDAQLFFDLSLELSEACGACHSEYWEPIS